jgi:hypothetical protein
MSRFGTNCVECHSTATWKEAAWKDVAARFDHNRTAFKLTGKHIGVDCQGCHRNNTFKETPQDCASCHAEPKVHMGNFGTNCVECHSTATWKDATLKNAREKFDHNRTAFKLTGKHIGVDCQACHKNNTFKETPTDCASCHVEPKMHKGNFGTNCAECHSTATWKDAAWKEVRGKFDHSRTAFKLTGKHIATDCQSCHKNNTFKETPKDCASCHAEPKAHKFPYGNACARCHTTETFSGSAFKHTFPINHGQRRAGAQANTCKTCHDKEQDKEVMFTTYTCYGCHQHQPAAMERRHPKVAKAELQFCAKCHKTGRGGRAALDRPGLDDMLAFSHTCDRLPLGGMCPSMSLEDSLPLRPVCGRMGQLSSDRFLPMSLDLAQPRLPVREPILRADSSPTTQFDRPEPVRRPLFPSLLAVRTKPYQPDAPARV